MKEFRVIENTSVSDTNVKSTFYYIEVLEYNYTIFKRFAKWVKYRPLILKPTYYNCQKYELDMIPNKINFSRLELVQSLCDLLNLYGDEALIYKDYKILISLIQNINNSADIVFSSVKKTKKDYLCKDIKEDNIFDSLDKLKHDIDSKTFTNHKKVVMSRVDKLKSLLN